MRCPNDVCCTYRWVHIGWMCGREHVLNLSFFSLLLLLSSALVHWISLGKNLFNRWSKSFRWFSWKKKIKLLDLIGNLLSVRTNEERISIVLYLSIVNKPVVEDFQLIHLTSKMTYTSAALLVSLLLLFWQVEFFSRIIILSNGRRISSSFYLCVSIHLHRMRRKESGLAKKSLRIISALINRFFFFFFFFSLEKEKSGLPFFSIISHLIPLVTLNNLESKKKKKKIKIPSKPLVQVMRTSRWFVSSFKSFSWLTEIISDLLYFALSSATSCVERQDTVIKP